MTRTADHAIEAHFIDRWSPRAFDPRPLPEAELLRLFEAARWAPSCMNSQPWRFVYALRDSADWALFVSLLNAGNQAWAQNASALVFVGSFTLMGMPGQPPTMPSPSHSFDTGAAWQSLALQAHAQGLITHGMAGVDFARAKAELGFPDTVKLEAAIAIGYPGKKEDLSEALQARETPSQRHPVSSFAFPGRYREA
jgi:nitroreductase